MARLITSTTITAAAILCRQAAARLFLDNYRHKEWNSNKVVHGSNYKPINVPSGIVRDGTSRIHIAGSGIYIASSGIYIKKWNTPGSLILGVSSVLILSQNYRFSSVQNSLSDI